MGEDDAVTQHDRGPIARTVETLLCGGWNEYCSIQSMPCFRPDEQISRRDVYVGLAAAVSIFLFALWPHFSRFHAVMAGVAAYRLCDIIFALTALGFMGRIRRRETTLKDLGEERLQRLLVSVIINYIDLLFSFSIVYLWLYEKNPVSFSEPLSCLGQAFFVSMTTMTTVGYGDIAPRTGLAMALCATQAILGVFVIVIFVGGVLARIRGAEPGESVHHVDLRWWRYLLPLGTLAGFILVFWWIT